MFLARDISYHIISLGCSKNLVDSERVNGDLSARGFRASSSPEEADIIIINTCGFIEDAKRESIDVILDAVRSRDGAPPAVRVFADGKGLRKIPFPIRVVVAGCLSQRYYDDIKKEMPEIDFLCGIPGGRFAEEMARAFRIRLAGRPGRSRKPLLEGLPYSYIKISEGCSNNCSYCAIPLIRGPLHSYSPDDILKDCRRAVAGGALELIFVGQDTAAYRKGRMGLAALAERASRLRGARWIRLLYCHPDHIDDSIITLLEKNRKVVKYIDIPFQHASAAVLRSMGRKGNAGKYSALVEKLRGRVPGIVIRSTFMVGYPGETEEDYQALLDFLKRVRLDRVGCFTYSREEGTRAASRDDTVSDREKRKRYNRLMGLQEGISLEKMREKIGRTVDVLVEEKVDRKTWIGRTPFDAPEVDGIFYLTAKDIMINSIVRAKVTDAVEYDLIGEIL